MTLSTLAFLLLCAHLDKLKAEWKTALSYTFQRCIEDKHHLNYQVNLHNRGKKIVTAQKGKWGKQIIELDVTEFCPPLLSDWRLKDRKADKGGGKDCRLLAESFGSGLRFLINALTTLVYQFH